MSNISIENKKILIVDDEPDVLDSLEELLDMCTTTRAQSFEEANHLLETRDFVMKNSDRTGTGMKKNSGKR